MTYRSIAINTIPKNLKLKDIYEKYTTANSYMPSEGPKYLSETIVSITYANICMYMYMCMSFDERGK